jgi:glycosyl hydrolase family 39 (putative alpha-L-iduronidase)/type IX secretion system substrate protein
MKNIFTLLLLSFFPVMIYATDISIDAMQKKEPNMRKIFDAFRSGNRAPQNRLREMNSHKVRMFPPLTASHLGFGTFFDVVKGTYPNLTFNWGLVDSDWVGPVIDEGTTLNLGYCYMPIALGDKVKGPPRDYDAWEEFNYQWAKHFNEKYGVNSFEVWNEPDYSDFFTGSKADYFEMYKYAVKGIRRAVPDAMVGGPALAESPKNWIGPFLDFIIENKLPVNFLSYHAQDNKDGFKDEGSKYHSRYLDILDELNQRGMDSVEIHLNEFSYELDPGQGSKYDKVECAAWFASSFKFMLNQMPRLALFNKTITNNGELADKWKYNGLITTDNTPKAKFNLFKMYAKMPFWGVDVSVGDTKLDAMAAMDDSTVGVMVWNKQDAVNELNLSISSLPFIADSVQIYLIDPEHSSYFDDSATKELEKIETIILDKSSYADTRNVLNHGIYMFLFKGTRPVTSINDPQVQKPDAFKLNNYPNPFNPQTTIYYTLKNTGAVKLQVFDLLGREVATLVQRVQQAGNYQVTFNASNIGGGVYFYKLTAGQFIQINKMLFVP